MASNSQAKRNTLIGWFGFYSNDITMETIRFRIFSLTLESQVERNTNIF